MKTNKTTFALFFGNRGFFPETLIAGARKEMRCVIEEMGYGTLMLDADATPYGAVESVTDGEKYAKFLRENYGKYDGVIVCLPNFGDETGAIAALQDCGTPILIQAYPDELNKMASASRRDAFCGKFSVMDVFCQYGLPFTTFTPHTVSPSSQTFSQHLRWFGSVCRIAGSMKRMTVGAIGARTTAFKTVRFDELTLQKYGITTEVIDLSEVMLRVKSMSNTDPKCKAKSECLASYTNWKGVPDIAFETISKLGVVLDDLISEYKMDAMSLRCWIELEKDLKISPCVLLSEINDRGIPAACELDVCNAVPMYALSKASEKPATCLDWNNNYGDDPDKCILFHCGPVPQSLMAAKGQVIEHPMFAKVLGAGCGYGCNVGRIAPAPITFSSTKTQDGKIFAYLGEGEVTTDKIADDFFGCCGVAKIPNLQSKLQQVGYNGYRHHVSVTVSHVEVPVREAFTRYLKYDVTEI